MSKLYLLKVRGMEAKTENETAVRMRGRDSDAPATVLIVWGEHLGFPTMAVGRGKTHDVSFLPLFKLWTDLLLDAITLEVDGNRLKGASWLRIDAGKRR